MTASSTTGIVFDPLYLKHKTGSGHPESPERLRAIGEVLKEDSSLISLKARPATREEIAWVHTSEHIGRIEETRQNDFGYLDADTPTGPESADAAYFAVGGVIEAVEAVDEKIVTNAFAFPRPPGHHAESTRPMGFCLFNNIAIAAEYLIKKKNKKRVAIIDFDVHHGNGTQNSFYARSDVLFVSLHRFPFYPGSGSEKEHGVGDGLGYTLNVPMDAYSDDEDYHEAFDANVIPKLENYQPDFILVSAGFDAHIRDPLGGMKLTKKAFDEMSSKLIATAQKFTDGKIVFVLEGGYDLKGLQEGTEAVLANLKR